jgi:hypothetical protein
MFRIKGITDVTDTCECCSRRGLKRVVALMPLDADGNEDGDAVYYGTSCAATAMRWTNTRILNEARAAQAKWEGEAGTARQLLETYEPVEFAPEAEQLHVLTVIRNNRLRDGETAAEAVGKLLAFARATLAAKP